MDVISNYLLNNHANLLYSIAALSLITELALTGLSGPLLFFAISCALTGMLVSFQIIHGWEMEILFVGLFSFLSMVILWKPLKKFQNKINTNNTSSDLVGRHVTVSETITESSGSVRYSGINWIARLNEDARESNIEVGRKVLITGVDGNIILVDIITA